MAYSIEGWQRVGETDLAVVQSFGAFAPGGRFLAAADTNTIEVRDSRNGSMIGTVEMLGVTSLAVSADGGLLVAADDEGTINAWSLPPVTPIWQTRLTMPPPAYAQVVYDVQFAAHGGLAVASKPAGVNNTLVEIWPVRPGNAGRPEPLWQGVMLNSDYQAFSPSPDGTRILLATDEGYWAMREGERLFIDGFFDSGEYTVLAFSPDGAHAIGVEPEGAWIYDAAQHALREIDGIEPLEEPTDVAWSPDGEAILITSEDGLSLCVREDDGFVYLGVIADSQGFEAAAFVDAATIAAKRGDTLLVFSTEQR